MKKSFVLWLLALSVLLSACSLMAVIPQEPQITLSEPTQPSAEETEEPTAPETAPETIPETVPETQPEQTRSEEPVITALQPGYYAVSSVGRDGDVSFYSSPDPANGYLRLNPDGTGRMLFEGVEADLTWDDEYVYWQGKEMPCVCMSYYDSELGRDDSMLAMYMLDPMVSIVFRPVQDPTAIA